MHWNISKHDLAVKQSKEVWKYKLCSVKFYSYLDIFRKAYGLIPCLNVSVSALLGFPQSSATKDRQIFNPDKYWRAYFTKQILANDPPASVSLTLKFWCLWVLVGINKNLSASLMEWVVSPIWRHHCKWMNDNNPSRHVNIECFTSGWSLVGRQHSTPAYIPTKYCNLIYKVKNAVAQTAFWVSRVSAFLETKHPGTRHSSSRFWPLLNALELLLNQQPNVRYWNVQISHWLLVFIDLFI